MRCCTYCIESCFKSPAEANLATAHLLERVNGKTKKTEEHSRFVEFWLVLVRRREKGRNKQTTKHFTTPRNQLFKILLGCRTGYQPRLAWRSMIFQHQN